MRHAPKTAIQFDRLRGERLQVLIHGEPRCGTAPNGPGRTTSLDAMVTCPKCIELLGGQR